jgi:peptide/nickel transport system permease protein
MLRFLVYRVATIVPVLIGVSVVVFLMMKLIPGDPAEAILGPAATTEKIEMVRRSLGLDRPFYVQYFRWLWKVLQGDFGMSIAVNVPVAQLVWPKFWNTVLLTLGSLVICVVVGLGVGVVSGTRQYSWFDRISMSLTLIVANTPGFWLGLIFMVVFALYLGWFPATGMYSMRASQKTFGDLIHHMVLPAITTASVSAAIIARLVRSSFLDVIRKHYITALRAKGLSERDIILRHGMKNAMPPIINIVGL